ncbi:MAG: polysaccharide deacetylase family protein [Bacteroidia bacterium]|nr:polysaccharide deacetylase family protein [Bacteroidia bacterium]
MMYLVKTPPFIPLLFPKYWWQLPAKTKELYLTFDDGPTPNVTEWVLKELARYQAKATFFLVGNNVSKFPEITRQIISEGHEIGNHTYTHLHGWKAHPEKYLEEINRTNDVIYQTTGRIPTLFRPPYGKFSRFARPAILQRHQIVMWDVLPGDFDPTISSQMCLSNALTHIKAGAIYVLHDSLKCQHKIEYVLPKLLDTIYERGLTSETLPIPSFLPEAITA